MVSDPKPSITSIWLYDKSVTRQWPCSTPCHYQATQDELICPNSRCFQYSCCPAEAFSSSRSSTSSQCGGCLNISCELQSNTGKYRTAIQTSQLKVIKAGDQYQPNVFHFCDETAATYSGSQCGEAAHLHGSSLPPTDHQDISTHVSCKFRVLGGGTLLFLTFP